MKKEDIKFLNGKGHICRYCDFHYKCLTMGDIKDYAKKKEGINQINIQIFDCSSFVFNEYVYGDKGDGDE